MNYFRIRVLLFDQIIWFARDLDGGRLGGLLITKFHHLNNQNTLFYKIFK